jgi:hypothetical protein
LVTPEIIQWIGQNPNYPGYKYSRNKFQLAAVIGLISTLEDKEAVMSTKIIRAFLIIIFSLGVTEGLGSVFNLQSNPFQAVLVKAQEPSEETPIPISNGGQSNRDNPDYSEAIERTAGLVWDQNAQDLAAQYGLNILNVTWEDTGRFYNSAVGPNISDVTIQIQHQNPANGQLQLTLMPVIRYPNFSDLSADLSLDDFYLLVGNERGNSLKKVSLRDYLGNFREYLSEPGSWAGRQDSLLAPRDSHVLVSAQAAFLPVPKQGQAEFNPVIFNYQSYQGDPAVLTIVATREGTSATIIDNVRDGFPAGFSWGQRLFFNQDGERASFTGQRLSDFRAQEQPSGDSPQAAGEGGLNMVLIIQVPLKQKFPMEGEMMPAAESAADFSMPMLKLESDVETAVISHGEIEGPFTEIDGLDIERDARFPIRVTVQFYKATSNGIVSKADMQEIADQIERVYSQADYVGSLVVDGGSTRPTEYDGPKQEPAGWWDTFWKRFEQNTGLDRFEAHNLWDSLRFYAGRWIEALR